MFVFAAGAADGFESVTAGNVDWPLLIRAELELLGGFWLVSGRFSRLARVAALVTCVGILAYDQTREWGLGAIRPVFGRVVAGPGWVLLEDLLIFAGVLWWRTAREAAVDGSPRPGRIASCAVIAAAFGVAVERAQLGQFPIIATVRSGRTSSGLDYLVYLPEGYYRSLRRWPVILTLHGRGEAGDDIGQVRNQGLPRHVEAGARLPFAIVAPQSPDWTWDVAALSNLLDEVIRRYRIDEERVYLVGNSMGGNGTWSLAAHSPGRFAAIAPICGRGDPAMAGRLRHLPTWAFHGADDRIVPPEESERMIAALQRRGRGPSDDLRGRRSRRLDPHLCRSDVL